MSNMPQNYMKSDYERADDDFYVEPRWCVRSLADAVRFDGKIYDPACGTGTIPEVFLARGFETFATDLVDRGYERAITPVNFLTADIVGEGFNLVTNPPFNLAEKFVRRGLALNFERVAIVQQTRFLNSQGRFALFNEHPPEHVLILSRRPSMPPGHRLAEMLADGTAFRGGTIDYAWIVWSQGFTGTTRLRWLNPE